MKIKKMRIIEIILAFCVLGCSSNNDSSKLKENANWSLSNVCEISRYNVNNILFPMLTEIVDDEKQCEYTNSLTTCFALTLKKHDNFTDLYFDVAIVSNIYPQTDRMGYFIFSKKIFLIDVSEKEDWMFLPTDDTLRIIKRKKLNDDFPYIDDTGSHWLYRCENKSFNLMQKSLCKY